MQFDGIMGQMRMGHLGLAVTLYNMCHWISRIYGVLWGVVYKTCMSVFQGPEESINISGIGIIQSWISHIRLSIPPLTLPCSADFIFYILFFWQYNREVCACFSCHLGAYNAWVARNLRSWLPTLEAPVYPKTPNLYIATHLLMFFIPCCCCI